MKIAIYKPLGFRFYFKKKLVCTYTSKMYGFYFAGKISGSNISTKNFHKIFYKYWKKVIVQFDCLQFFFGYNFFLNHLFLLCTLVYCYRKWSFEPDEFFYVSPSTYFLMIGYNSYVGKYLLSFTPKSCFYFPNLTLFDSAQFNTYLENC